MMAVTRCRRASRWLLSGSALALGLLVAVPAEAQDLAELARKEKERRAKLQKKSPTYTEGSASAGTAGAAGSKPGSVTTLSEPTSAAPSAASPSTPVGDPEAQKAEWKARAVAARTAVDREAQVVAALEREIAVYASDQTPLTAQEAQDPMRLQKREVRLTEMRRKLEIQKEVLANARKGVDALEAEARRSGVPAGWLR